MLLRCCIKSGRGAHGPCYRCPSEARSGVIYAALVIIAGVLATTVAQTQVLARLPLQNLLKNELQVDRSANAAFLFWAGLASSHSSDPSGTPARAQNDPCPGISEPR
jgi:hypothetical protein